MRVASYVNDKMFRDLRGTPSSHHPTGNHGVRQDGWSGSGEKKCLVTLWVGGWEKRKVGRTMAARPRPNHYR